MVRSVLRLAPVHVVPALGLATDAERKPPLPTSYASPPVLHASQLVPTFNQHRFTTDAKVLPPFVTQQSEKPRQWGG